MAGGIPVLGDSLAALLDRRGGAHHVAVGPPWDTLASPGARTLAPRDAARLADVSRARAAVEIGGGPLVEPTALPAGLALERIDVVPGGTAADPLGTTYPLVAVAFRYADRDGRVRLWLSQSTFVAEPRIEAPGAPVAFDHVDGHRHADQGNGEPLVALAWRAGDRWLTLTGRLGEGVTESALRRVAASVPIRADAPVVPPTATPRRTASSAPGAGSSAGS